MPISHTQAKKIVFKLMLFQLLIGLIGAGCFALIGGEIYLISSVLGVLTIWSGTLLAYIKNFMRTISKIEQSFRSFFQTSMLKYWLSATLAGIFILNFELEFVPFVGGMIITVIGYWPMLILDKSS
jgi:F0F1-type ATP synthase assembly protein I